MPRGISRARYPWIVAPLGGAIVTALYQRERIGKGGYVGSSLLANGLWANGCSVQAALCGEKVVPQPPRERGLNEEPVERFDEVQA